MGNLLNENLLLNLFFSSNSFMLFYLAHPHAQYQHKQRAEARGDIGNIIISHKAVVPFSRRLNDLEWLYQCLLN